MDLDTKIDVLKGAIDARAHFASALMNTGTTEEEDDELIKDFDKIVISCCASIVNDKDSKKIVGTATNVNGETTIVKPSHIGEQTDAFENVLRMAQTEEGKSALIKMYELFLKNQEGKNE